MYLSIIIPIYNVEKYIDRCLQSIFSQNVSAKDFEVICVNDGTPDKSMDIVNEYASKHSNLYIINQENQGLSVARNNGMAIAKGDYLWFVDSDDFVTGNSLDLIQKTTYKYNCDLIGFCVNKIIEQDGYSVLERANVKSISYYKPLRGKKCYGRIQTGMVQRYVFSRDFLLKNKLTYLPGVWYEDEELMSKAIFLANTIIISPEIIYNYLVRAKGSIMSSIKLKSIIDCEKINKSWESFSEKCCTCNKDRTIFWDAEFDNLKFILDCQKLDIEGYDDYMKDKIIPYKRKAIQLALKSMQYRTGTKIKFLLSNL
jgi:glycosyltransferase involved in cell wall biosynthesis